jgi:hypothetical protein
MLWAAKVLLIQQQDDNPEAKQMAIRKIPRMRVIFISGLGVRNAPSPSGSNTIDQRASPGISSGRSDEQDRQPDQPFDVFPLHPSPGCSHYNRWK